MPVLKTPIDINKMSIAERILLAEELWDSVLPEQEQLDVTEEQKQELDNRLNDYHRSPEEGRSWEDVKKRIINEQ